jgi:hypothetical protein
VPDGGVPVVEVGTGVELALGVTEVPLGVALVGVGVDVGSKVKNGGKEIFAPGVR